MSDEDKGGNSKLSKFEDFGSAKFLFHWNLDTFSDFVGVTSQDVLADFCTLVVWIFGVV